MTEDRKVFGVGLGARVWNLAISNKGCGRILVSTLINSGEGIVLNVLLHILCDMRVESVNMVFELRATVLVEVGRLSEDGVLFVDVVDLHSVGFEGIALHWNVSAFLRAAIYINSLLQVCRHSHIAYILNCHRIVELLLTLVCVLHLAAKDILVTQGLVLLCETLGFAKSKVKNTIDYF